MSASNEWWDHHLTPRGWEVGSERIDFHGVTEKPTPEGSVKKVKLKEYMSSGASPIQFSYEEEVLTDDKEELKRLEALYGDFPPGYNRLPNHSYRISGSL